MDFESIRPIHIENLVRLGNKHDGGYVVPVDAVNGTRMLVSFGVADDWSFEKDFISVTGSIPVDAYDHTVGLRLFTRKALINLRRQVFRHPNFEPNTTSLPFRYLRFFRGKNRHIRRQISNQDTQRSISVGSVLRSCPVREHIFLKMDIEGDEYVVLDDILKYADRIRGLVIEFHDIPARWAEFRKHIEGLRNEFYVCHVHGNNFGGVSVDGLPNVLEISFIHKSLVGPSVTSSSRTYPIEGLDSPNNPAEAEINLDFR